MSIAKRMMRIKESPTMAVMAKADKLKREGKDVVILAAGEPDFNTPRHICDAAIAAINGGKTKYTNVGGMPELKQAVVNKFIQENNLEYTTNEVIVSAGGKHSIFNTLMALLNDGDEVIIPAPYWVSYPDMVALCGGSAVCIPCGIEDNYKFTAQKLKQALTPKTKALILNSPSNPTGMVYSAEELSEIAHVLKHHPQVYVITDDIYEHLIYNDTAFSNIANVAPDMLERIIVINGVSKAYAMTGWRIGFAAVKDSKLVKAMEIIQSQSTSNPCSISQAAAIAALNSGLQCLKPMVKEFTLRNDYVNTRLNAIDGIKCTKAAGAFYAFFECSAAIKKLHTLHKISEPNDLEFANYLLDNYMLAGVPGSAFGLDDHMRLSFATSLKELEKGLDRLEQALTV